MSELSNGERKSRGVRARVELEQTEAAFERMKANAVRNWIATDPADTAKREECWRLIHVIETARIELQALVNDGLMAEAEDAQAS